jgi:DNA (cytosine-5)-methyltransferase 1
MANPLTYISLFSSAGVGCYGFKTEGFKCVATNELVERRLAVQKSNKKCKYDSGYILGDITESTIKQLLFDEIAMWKAKERLSEIDVVIATPPCQGMSIANHKKTTQEIVRNSLIVESIEIISEIQPKIFIFENVPLFLRTLCTDTDGVKRPIAEAIERNLGLRYSIFSRVLNFKDYGACSSRSRTLVIAVRRDLADFFSPLELFPVYKSEITLRDCIGEMKPLTEFGEIDSADIYHNFRMYPEHMRGWISELSEGQSAFDNEDELRIPHQIVDGKRVINQRKNGDKYRRQLWDKVGPCVHTRNDQLASQNTVHPSDDRVFSVRELMMMMTIPSAFRWIDTDFAELNAMSEMAKRSFLKKNEINIRQSLGEAVPTEIFRSIAANIKFMLGKRFFKDLEIKAEINVEQLTDVNRLINYLKLNPRNLGFASLCRLAELANSKRNEQEAYFTNKSLITEIIGTLPDIGGESVSVLEPSVGAGNFIPFIIKLFEHKREVRLTVVDIDKNALAVLRELLKHTPVPANFYIRFECNDFLFGFVFGHYDLVIGNPPFSKSAKGKQLEYYRSNSVNKQAVNTSAFFLEKALILGDYVALIMPKFLLNTPEFAATRDLLTNMRMDTILDFGERGFGGVLIETVALCVNPNAKPASTTIISITDNECRTVPQNYICDKNFPYWLIYRNVYFDKVCRRMQFNVFEVFRDRQLTNAMMTGSSSSIRVIKSRNISDDGTEIIDIDGYDAYVEPATAENLSVYRFFDDDSVYLTPNMTYKPRVIRKPKGVLVNGSAAILSLKEGQPPLSDDEMRFFSSDEYREFYRIARNRQTRSLNVDANSVFFFGRLITEEAYSL